MICTRCHGKRAERIPLPYPKVGHSLRKCPRCEGTGELKPSRTEPDGAEQAKYL